MIPARGSRAGRTSPKPPRRATRPRWRGRTSAALLGAACLLRYAGGPASAQAPPEFASRVELITLDVAAVDASGRAVEGLSKEDFVLEVDGRPQPIVNFEAVSLASEGEAEAPEISAVASSGGRRPGRAFALVADDLSLAGEQSERVRRVIANFIERSLGPGDAVILATTSGDLWWSARLPSGRDDLLAVLERVQGRFVDPSTRDQMTEHEAYWITNRESGTLSDGALAEGMARGPTSVLQRVALRMWDAGQCGSRERGTYEACAPLAKSLAENIDGARRERTGQVLVVLTRAVNALAASPGHRAIVLLSPGFSLDEDLPQRQVTEAAQRAHTLLHFVDTRGLETGSQDASAIPESMSLPSPSRSTASRFESQVVSSDGSRALAQGTGGYAVRNNNDLVAATHRIAAESRTFYLLGFQPPAGKPGSFRKLRVSVTRPGVTTRARPGYRLYEATRETRVRYGSEARIPLRLASYVLDPLPRQQTRVVAVTEVDVAALAARSGSDAGALQLRLEAVPRDGGKPRVEDFSLETGPGAAGRPGAPWPRARIELELGKGVYQLRATVFDPTSLATGAVEQRITVPAPMEFRISTPVLSDRFASGGDSGAAPTPLLVAHDAFAPSSARPLVAAFDVFGAAPDPETGQPRVVTGFVLETSAGRPLAAPPLAPLTPTPEGRLQQLVALPALPPGEYTLAITAEDQVDETRIGVRRRFTIEGAPAAGEGAPPSKAPPAGSPPPAEPPAAAVPSEVVGILGRAATYVSAYGRTLTNVIAEEDCQQIYEPDNPSRQTMRNTRAGVFFVTLPGPLPWATFRDVWQVDGTAIADRGDRLARLFHEQPATARERARAILEESARYNLGPVRRTMNIPTLALLFLDRENQARFAFELKGRQTQQGADVVELAFREKSRPTLIAGASRDGAPARGRFWIEPEHGAVLKTDVEYDIDPQDPYHRSRARVVTEYRHDPRLAILVPSRMQETYTSLAAQGPGFGVLTDAHARSRDDLERSGVLTVRATTTYSGFLRYGVSTDEAVTGVRPEPR